MLNIYLGIGGNLGNRLENIRKVITLISERIAVPEKVSPIYLSEPWGFDHAKYFTNAVIKLNTDLLEDDVLKIILEIEKELKRIRTKSGYQGRTMDIDILYFGDKEIKRDNLEIPHPRIKDRLFVLLPLKDIEPSFIDPISKVNIIQMLESCNDKGKIKRLRYGA
ncbi:MAG: 2-amino-4-hydroxy-6-hydroxymethyldihydropteridine diphosphokinase [Marinilabiliales bacterium]|nr:MAG: 2-amino-4-hydroxy-6-hydroxymethyldihydropteridine diphosphokinase [Marinilabiliales bacterium]